MSTCIVECRYLGSQCSMRLRHPGVRVLELPHYNTCIMAAAGPKLGWMTRCWGGGGEIFRAAWTPADNCTKKPEPTLGTSNVSKRELSLSDFCLKNKRETKLTTTPLKHLITIQNLKGSSLCPFTLQLPSDDSIFLRTNNLESSDTRPLHDEHTVQGRQGPPPS